MAAVAINRDNMQSMSRVTAEGRTLTYDLTVIQQPERARACGSGAKSSADRRPVDPPPVVELRVYEGDGANKVDITFSYDANFFCFATLEAARPIAHGRVPQPAQQPPVLTGMPVSGMAYLDRPAEAGYFIFPDLSVRHEGKYVLAFSLYEHTKSGQDKSPETNSFQPEGESGSFDFILEVKSAPFTVFSAKKFPGLAESTVLSRTVAEQGCRVRIRRDVRMRRRDGKGGADYDDYEEGYSRARSVTPVDPSDYPRNRSISNTSVDKQPYEPHRRPSAYLEPSYQSAPQHPQAFVGFGGRSVPQPQFQTPQFAPQNPHAQSLQYLSFPQASHFRQKPQSAPVYQDRTYGAYQGINEGYEHEYRRPSLNYATPQPQHSEQESARPPTNYSAYPPRPEQPVLAPIKVAPALLEPKYENLTSPTAPMSANNRRLSSLPSPGYQERPYRAFPATAAAESRGSKRSFESSFPSNAYPQALHNGMRPSSSHGTSPGFQDTEEAGIDAFTMQYRRADGSAQNRELPSLA